MIAATDTRRDSRNVGLETTQRPLVDIVVPVYNEQTGPRAHRSGACTRYLADAVPVRLAHHDRRQRQHRRAPSRSRDRLAAELPRRRRRAPRREGRGRALRAAWSAATPTVLAYMDVDLSTDLARCCRSWRRWCPATATSPSGPGWRAAPGWSAAEARVHLAQLQPAPARHAAARFSDAQCGFKAIRADVAARLLPLVQDDGWFFDTELLVLAERPGLRIHEVPVDWVDDPDSRVDIVRHRARRPQRCRPPVRPARQAAARHGHRHRSDRRTNGSTTAIPTRPSGAGAAVTGRRAGRVRSSAAATSDPRWVRPALLARARAGRRLCLWDLTINGYANTYYAAAAQCRQRELEGVVLRLARSGQLHHRRQAAAVAVADGRSRRASSASRA